MGTHQGTNPTGTHQRSSKTSYSQYISVRQRLDDLGYTNFLSNDSVPLVEKLLNDLVRHKDLHFGSSKKAENSQKKSGLVELEETDLYTQQVGHAIDDQNQHNLLAERNIISQHLEKVKIENAQLKDKIAGLKFVLDQNSALIKKLKKENDEKSHLILQLQNCSGEQRPKNVHASIEKDGDLPGANISKIQSLYQKILAASDNPAIVDWVQAAESKISSLERKLENSCYALSACQQMCEDYKKQALDYENRLTQVGKANANKESQNYAQMKSRLEQKEKENRELQSQLSEAVRKQHEAMSRAIMLAGPHRPPAPEMAAKPSAVEKKLIGLQSERGVLKQMLTTTQRERDELMKEVQRLHSQEATLMNEIHTLVNPSKARQPGPKGKTVRFEPRVTDSGIDSESTGSTAGDHEGGAGRNRELWLKRLTEQRQLYYDNVSQLLNFMKNRQELPERRPSPQPHPTQPSNQPNSFSPSNFNQPNFQQPPTLHVQQPVCQPQQPYVIQQPQFLPQYVISQPNQAQGMYAPAQPYLPQSNMAQSAGLPLQSVGTSTLNLKDRKTQTEPETADVIVTPTAEELSHLPRQFQDWANNIIEEKRLMKEQITALRVKLEELDERSKQAADLLRQAEESNQRLQSDVQNANARVQSTERELLLERTKLQQMQLDITDATDKSLAKKFEEKSTQLDSARIQYEQLQHKVTALEGQVAQLQNQLSNVQAQRSNVEQEQRHLHEELGTRNIRITQLERQLSAKQEAYNQRQAELDAVNQKLNAIERELQLERSKLKQLRLDVQNADGTAAALTKTVVDKTTQLDAVKQRCSELERQVATFENQVGGLQGQLRSLQVNRAQSETEQRLLHDELDACKARIGQLEKQLALKQDTLTTLQSSIQTYENRLRQMEQEGNDRQSQSELSKRQNQRLVAEIDQAKNENAALRLENERLVSSVAMTRVDLERERQGAEDLRREMQSYVSQIRKVESVLAQKDEERDYLLKQFQQLANESNSFDAEREQMERTLRSQQQQTSALQTELTNVRRRLGELEQLYSQQRSSGAEAEVQAEDLQRRLAVLERDLRDARDDRMRLEQQLAGAHDLHRRLEKQMERLRSEAAQADSTTHQMEAEATKLQDEMNILDQRLIKEKDSVRNLESIVSTLRQERNEQETHLRTLSQDLTRLHHREILLQEELANVKAEQCALEGKCTDLTRENQRLKQECLQERFEREKTRQEYKRMANLSETPLSRTPANASPATVGVQNLASGDSNAVINGSPRKRPTVASRFCNNETQTFLT